jgi:hypothetical protein
MLELLMVVWDEKVSFCAKFWLMSTCFGLLVLMVYLQCVERNVERWDSYETWKNSGL